MIIEVDILDVADDAVTGMDGETLQIIEIAQHERSPLAQWEASLRNRLSPNPGRGLFATQRIQPADAPPYPVLAINAPMFKQKSSQR